MWRGMCRPQPEPSVRITEGHSPIKRSPHQISGTPRTVFDDWSVITLSLQNIAYKKKKIANFLHFLYFFHSVDCARAHKGLFIGILILVLTIISLILFFVLISRPEFVVLAVTEVTITELVRKLTAETIQKKIHTFFFAPHSFCNKIKWLEFHLKIHKHTDTLWNSYASNAHWNGSSASFAIRLI